MSDSNFITWSIWIISGRRWHVVDHSLWCHYVFAACRCDLRDRCHPTICLHAITCEPHLINPLQYQETKYVTHKQSKCNQNICSCHVGRFIADAVVGGWGGPRTPPQAAAKVGRARYPASKRRSVRFLQLFLRNSIWNIDTFMGARRSLGAASAALAQLVRAWGC